jgi:SNF2 family DNA or RNA helicase
MVRFRGKSAQGTLPHNVAAVLVPLLRAETPMISLQAEALMDEHGIPIGGDVPIALRIFVEDPIAFFDLFESMTPEKSARSQYFGEDQPRKKGLLIDGAAFALLQWAEYGDDPTFVPPTREETKEESSDEEVEVLGEDGFEAEDQVKKDSPDWAKNVVDEGMRLAETSDPVGFTGKVVLRPYQRQALHWMLNRESASDNRDELEKELTLLAELSRNASRLRPMDPPTEQDIVCEVGPVRVSPSMASKSKTINGVENPVNHPLWQRRFLASPDKESVISFYVNELLGVASSKPPNPPRHCVGGILADAMGLGKTVMLLALILKDKELNERKSSPDDKMDNFENVGEESAGKKQHSRTTLVVAPLSLISQWEEELATKTEFAYKVYYAGTAKGNIRTDSFDEVDVVVTTCAFRIRIVPLNVPFVVLWTLTDTFSCLFFRRNNSGRVSIFIKGENKKLWAPLIRLASSDSG